MINMAPHYISVTNVTYTQSDGLLYEADTGTNLTCRIPHERI